jgi:hypothetical protein
MVQQRSVGIAPASDRHWSDRDCCTGLHGLEQKDIDNEARCSAFIRRSGTFDDIIFQVKTHDMSGPANYGPATDK